MTTLSARLMIPAIAAFLLAVSFSVVSAADSKTGPKLAHMVFFTLKDRSPEAREKFIASCHKYLTGHQGVSFFAVGTIADDVNEGAVSVRDFDVSLHAVFASKEDEATYLKHPRHLQFVEENKANFEKVRVFDSYVTTP
jgi:hypothetical protein